MVRELPSLMDYCYLSASIRDFNREQSEIVHSFHSRTRGPGNLNDEFIIVKYRARGRTAVFDEVQLDESTGNEAFRL